MANTNSKHKKYDGSAIEILQGLEPVRRRPGMYTDTTNPNHLAAEVIDNSVDEALGGYADSIKVVLYQDGSLEVTDNGRGIPVDVHPVEQIPAIELIFGRLHAGGKFSQDNYAFSGGLHGVGVSVVNALSLKTQAVVKRDGSIWSIEFSGGEIVCPLEKIGEDLEGKTGTSVRFKPDPKYFDSDKFDVSALKHLLKAKAVLCPGLTVSFFDENTNESLSWSHEGSLSDYLRGLLKEEQILPDLPFGDKVSHEEGEVEWAIAWVCKKGFDRVQESYVNLIPTPEGGTHVNGLRSGMLCAMREFCELHGLLPRNLKLTADDVWSQVSFALSLKIYDPQFAGQTKEKLSNRQCAGLVEKIIKDRLSLFLNANVHVGREIASLIIEKAKEREALARVVERKKAVRGPQLPGKLVDCTSKDPGSCELFIVEGDSAGGSARQARESSFQAILPLRGKILNTWEASANTALASDEIRAISVAIGCDIDSDDLTGLRYDKICILADADSDGLHIGTLLCALFVRHFTRLVEQGHVYVACPPLYRIDCGKIKDYALDDAELAQKQQQFLKKGVKKDNIKIQRFKGLGEMNPEQLRETTLSPGTRRLMQLTLDDENKDKTFALLDMLMSRKRAADRRSWLEDKGDQAQVLD